MNLGLTLVDADAGD